MLESIRKDIEQLIARYEAVKVENENLRRELQACKETGNAQKAKIMELEEEVSSLLLSQAFNAAPGSDAKAKLDSLIKEIDRCISALEES
ncbi:MAG: hypothetical protein IJ813_03725 [Bacteroidales bacterium]|jgi:cell division septum initiation protein DivIVA|nr:hypothetical protein [Bacteroidales bacterium]